MRLSGLFVYYKYITIMYFYVPIPTFNFSTLIFYEVPPSTTMTIYRQYQVSLNFSFLARIHKDNFDRLL